MSVVVKRVPTTRRSFIDREEELLALADLVPGGDVGVVHLHGIAGIASRRS
jgi:hypothetical protein